VEKLFAEVLVVLRSCFRRLERQVPPPKRQAWGNEFVFRCQEKDIYQAIIQKLARIVSGLHAILCLHQNGFLQEQGVIQRTVDELVEDVFFLIGAINEGKIQPIHREFLDGFFAEEFNPAKPGLMVDRPPPVVRKKIRAYIVRTLTPNANRSKTLEVQSIVASAYSGYVHGASPHIMDMYAGDQQRFLVEGMLGTPRMDEHKDDAWNSYFRGLCAARAVGKAFGDASLVDALAQFIDKFEKESEPLRQA
jgi:hypothetical protein